MCVTFLATAEEDLLLRNYTCILMNNRDEDFGRPTSGLAWRNGILAGRDEQANERGTWLGIDRRGRIGNLLSITEPAGSQNKAAPSRGALVNELLASLSVPDFLSAELCPRAGNFNGFQFLALDRIDGLFELYSLTNKLTQTGPVHWPKGIYGFGNSPRSAPYRKVVEGEAKFRQLLEHFEHSDRPFDEAELVQALFRLASDTTAYFPDEQIRLQTGCPEGKDELYRLLCSLFVNGNYPDGRRYGTRCTSVILVDGQGEVDFNQRMVLDPDRPMDDPEKWEHRVERFRLET